MDRETPSVPITTLAGVASLTDLLDEMPLPTPQPQTLGNKSLLFHPRVAEEAQNLLKVRDEVLTPQLGHALSQTMAEHIECIEYQANDSVEPPGDLPALLQTILAANRSAFPGESDHDMSSKPSQMVTFYQNVGDVENNVYANNVFEAAQTPENTLYASEQVLHVNHQPMSVPMQIEMDLQSQTQFQHQQMVHSDAAMFHSPPTMPMFDAKRRNMASDDCSVPAMEMKNAVVLLERLDVEAVLIQKRKRLQDASESPPESEIEDDHIAAQRKRMQEEDASAMDNFSALVASKKRRDENEGRTPQPVIKPRLQRVEKKLAMALQPVNYAQVMESSTYTKFLKSVEYVLHFYSSIEASEFGDEGMIPDRLLLKRHIMQELATESAKLKALGAMEMLSTDKLVKLLNALHVTIRGADRMSPITDEESENMRQIWAEKAMERVIGAADASWVCMNILTSPRMPKQVYNEEIIDHIVEYIKYQLINTIFPSYDITFRLINKKKDGRKKKSVNVLEKNIQGLYNKIRDIVSLLANLIEFQLLTDTTILHLTSLGVSPFFVENVRDLQLNCLQLVTKIFTKYDKHRRNLLEDILASISRLPSSKRSLRTYKLSSEEYIQMLTALVLQLIQCIVVLPDDLTEMSDLKDAIIFDRQLPVRIVDKDVLMSSKLRDCRQTVAGFLAGFLSKCSTKTGEMDYRPLFENFVQDLLTTANKPEWPATELILTLLGTLLMANLSDKSIDLSLRVASLDYLGVVAARLRKHSVMSENNLKSVDRMVKEIRAVQVAEEDVEDSANLQSDDERVPFLQRILLDFLAVHAQTYEAFEFARYFCILQWYEECNAERHRMKSRKTNNTSNHRNRIESESEDENEEPSFEHLKAIDERKKFLLKKVLSSKECSASAGNKVRVYTTYIDYSMAELIVQYLASKRPSSKNLDGYLIAIMKCLSETSIAMRTKAVKCMSMIIDADPAVLGHQQIQRGLGLIILDQSASVREAAVDLVGKYVLNRPEFLPNYYTLLADRILDTGVSVRKRVIKIFKHICMDCPEFPKIPEICAKMIRRINDEDGIRKLVMEVFQNMWFTAGTKTALLRKVMNITDVVASCQGMRLEFFEQLLVNLFKPKSDKEDANKVQTEPPKALLIASKEIVDCLIENVLKHEESSDAGASSERLVASITTLYVFAKIRPQLVVQHASTLQPYLSVKCNSREEIEVIGRVSKILELVVPLMEHPSESFLSQLEEDLMKLIVMCMDPSVVSSCIACLAGIIHRVTRNFKLIRDLFLRFYDFLEKFYNSLHEDNFIATTNSRYNFKRSLYIVGMILRYFDFANLEVGEHFIDLKEKIYEMFMFLLDQDDYIQLFTLKALGSMCVRHYEFLLRDKLKDFYLRMLTSKDVPQQNRIEVLNNIKSYLVEEETRMIQQDREWSKRAQTENIKEMNDVSSGMASTIIQIYIKEVLHSSQDQDARVRQPALTVIQLISQQGLVNPIISIPYLIAMTTDSMTAIYQTAETHLLEIINKYPGFLYSQALTGMRLSYDLQCRIETDGVVRGSRVKTQGDAPSALNGFLYSLLRNNRQQRRALVLIMLKQFDLGASNLSFMLYIADNMAHFPYQVQDELLFIMKQINIVLTATGNNVMQNFRDCLMPTERQRLAMQAATSEAAEAIAMREVRGVDEDEEEDMDSLMERTPQDVTLLAAVMLSAQGCLLLIALKQYLRDAFSLKHSKIQEYSTSEPVKVHEKATNRKNKTRFNPKSTMDVIKQRLSGTCIESANRRDLISQYLDFKQLMMEIDPIDGEEKISDASPPRHCTGRPTSSVAAANEQAVIGIEKEHTSPKVPKTVKSNRRNEGDHKARSPRKSTEKTRKVRAKKKRKKVSTDEESDPSDPDYMG